MVSDMSAELTVCDLPQVPSISQGLDFGDFLKDLGKGVARRIAKCKVWSAGLCIYRERRMSSVLLRGWATVFQFRVVESVRPTYIQFVCYVTMPDRFEQQVADEVDERGGGLQKTHFWHSKRPNWKHYTQSKL